MFCFMVRRNLSRHVDGQVRPELAEKITRHLATCSACEEMQREFQEGLNFLKSAERPQLPTGLWDRIIERVPEREKKEVHSYNLRTRPFRILQIAGYAAAAASILMALYVGISTSHPAEGGAPTPEHFAAERLLDLDSGLRNDPVSLHPALENENLYRIVLAKESSR